MANNIVFTKTLPASSATSIATSQSPGSAALTLNGAAVTNGVATIDTYSALTNSEPGVRVTITSGGNDASISFVITGTNSSGHPITDTVAGTDAGTAVSNLDFVTVTSIKPTAAIASTVTAGNDSVGSSRWVTWSWATNPPMNISIAVELASGSATFTGEYTYDDPNNLPIGVNYPLPFDITALTSKSATTDGSITNPVIATRVTINSGTGTIRVRMLQAGIG